jgi:hypothetical protein
VTIVKHEVTVSDTPLNDEAVDHAESGFSPELASTGSAPAAVDAFLSARER